MSELYRVIEEGRLDGGVLLVALEGWIDAGLGASGAVTHLLPGSSRVVEFDGEDLLDRRARRPVVELSDGRLIDLTWPTIQVRATTGRDGTPIGLLVGPEPDYHWRRFVDAVAALVRELRVRLVVSLGAFPAPAPHTRPVRVAATSPNEALVAKVGTVPGRLTVPAGIEAPIELAVHAAGVPVLGLWARVPHYVANFPFPAASAALLETVATVGEVAIDVTGLYTAADAARQQVDELIGQSGEHQAMVRQLEERLDEAEGNPLDLGEIPSGDQIAAELERYLRGESGGS